MWKFIFECRFIFYFFHFEFLWYFYVHIYFLPVADLFGSFYMLLATWLVVWCTFKIISVNNAHCFNYRLTLKYLVNKWNKKRYTHVMKFKWRTWYRGGWCWCWWWCVACADERLFQASRRSIRANAYLSGMIRLNEWMLRCRADLWLPGLTLLYIRIGESSSWIARRTCRLICSAQFLWIYIYYTYIWEMDIWFCVHDVCVVSFGNIYAFYIYYTNFDW